MKAITFGIIIVFIGVVSCSKSSKTQKGEIELNPPHLLYQQNLTTIILVL